MEIIEKMGDDQYEAICDAGVDLVREVAAALKRHGLSGEHAFNVLIVAAAGVSAASGQDSSKLAHGVDSVIHMWSVRDVDGNREVSFDSSNRRPPRAMDPMESN